MRRRIAEIGALDRPDPRPRVVCIEWTNPLMVGGHWVPEMVRIAGGIDVLGEEGAPSRYVSWDEVTPKLDPSRHTVLTVPERLAKLTTDPWEEFDGIEQRLPDLAFTQRDACAKGGGCC